MLFVLKYLSDFSEDEFHILWECYEFLLSDKTIKRPKKLFFWGLLIGIDIVEFKILF